MEKITAVLIEKGPEYPDIVLERIDLGFFDEILVIVDSPSVFHRYLAAQQAKNDIIFVMDSDCLVNYQVLFESYNGRITNAMPRPFQEKYKVMECTLVGWGCYFPKHMLDAFGPYVAKYGMDDPHLLREADRIFTHLNQPWNTITLPHEDLNQTQDRMGYQPEHYTSAAEAIQKAKSLY